MKGLFFLIKSLEKGEKRKFRQLFAMKSRKQDYFTLYDSLNRAKSLPQESFYVRKFGSEGNYQRIRDQLIKVLFEFIGRNDESPKEKVIAAEVVARKMIDQNNFEMASIAISNGISIAIKENQFLASFGLLDLCKLIPKSTLPQATRSNIKVLSSYLTLDEKIKGFEKQIKKWPLQGGFSQKLESEISVVEKEIEKIEEANFPQPLLPRLILVKRKICVIKGDLFSAIEFAKKYVSAIQQAKLTLAEREHKILLERRDLALIFSAQGMTDCFFEASRWLLPINYSQPIIKFKAQIQLSILELSHGIDYGETRNSHVKIKRAEMLLNKRHSFELSEWEEITLLFLLGRFHFIMGDYSETNKILHKLTLLESEEAVFKINLPFVQIIRILCLIEKKQSSFAIILPLFKYLQGIIKAHGLKHKYFELFEKLVRYYLSQQCIPPNFILSNLKNEMNELLEDTYESWPFHRFDLFGWINAKIEKIPLSGFYQVKKKESPEKILAKLSEGQTG